jgi:hypothetical protein
MALTIKLIKFHDGVYLHGRVVQSVGVGGQEAEGQSMLGLQRVESATGSDAGVVIKHQGKFFFVPWTSISSCEIADPAGKSLPVDASDLLGDEVALEKATRPAPAAPRR